MRNISVNAPLMANIGGKVKLIVIAMSLAFSTAMPSAAAELMAKYVEGTHYQKVPTPVPSRETEQGQIEVIEVFSYGCNHCYNFDPIVESWHKEHANVAFRRMPAVFDKALARAFYTAEALGVLEQVHAPLFRAKHVESINIGDPRFLAQLFQTEAEVSEKDFNAAFDSFGVRAKIEQAQGQGRAFRLRAVPSMVVDGKYLVDSSMVDGGNAEMLEVVEFLVARTLAKQGSAN